MNELRKDPLLNRWVAVLGDSKPVDYYLSLINTCKPTNDGQKVQSCKLCLGRENETPPEIFAYREDGSHTSNSPNWITRVIPQLDYVFRIEGDLGRKGFGMYDKMNSIGANEIIIESPIHNRPPEDIGLKQMSYVLKTYKNRLIELERDPRLRYTFVFKDTATHQDYDGHPHSKVLSPPVIPKGIKDELDGAKNYFYYKERCIFCDIIQEELGFSKRIIMETADFVAFIPYAPKNPFEIWIIPKRHDCAYQSITDNEIDDLSLVLTTILKKIRKALNEPSYYYVIHNAPNRMPRKDYWHTIGEDFHWHIEIIPTMDKMSCFEAQNDFYILYTSPEDAAKIIKEVR
ncbi:MAG: HIT domain-containing protein [Thermodesulfovibrionales bacterium]|nr:HIT domain-containing protein [Thermodesulfovibrionales bacterium]